MLASQPKALQQGMKMTYRVSHGSRRCKKSCREEREHCRTASSARCVRCCRCSSRSSKIRVSFQSDSVKLVEAKPKCVGVTRRQEKRGRCSPAGYGKCDPRRTQQANTTARTHHQATFRADMPLHPSLLCKAFISIQLLTVPNP